jgi:hypothetical protein
MRSIGLMAAVAVAATLAAAVPANAVTFSSPLLTAVLGQQNQCRVSNVGTTPVEVSGKFFDSSGNVEVPVNDGCAAIGGVLPGGDTCILSIGVGAVRCAIEASSSKLRVVLITADINGTIATEPATRK